LFAKLKVRARLILVGRRAQTFFYTSLFFLLRTFCFAAAAACVGIFILLVSQNMLHDRSGGYFLFVCACLVMIFLICVYFFALLTLKRSLYFEKIIAGSRFSEEKMSFGQEVRATLQTLLASLAVYGIKLLWLLFFCSPGLALLLLVSISLQRGGLAANVFYALCAGSACLILFGILFYFCTAQRYLLAVRIAGLKGRGVIAAIKESARLMDGSSCAVAMFKLGLAAWLVPCLWIVPAFYIVPYSRLSFELLCEKYMTAPNAALKEREDVNLFSTKRLPQI
jgi:uncharacterized membrane protein